MPVCVQLKFEDTRLSIVGHVEQRPISDMVGFGIERVTLTVLRGEKWNEVIARALHAIVYTSH